MNFAEIGYARAASATWWHHLSQSRDIDLASKSVLIIDDEEMIRKLIHHTVSEGMGCEAFTAASGEIAVELVKQKSPDVIFTDMIMPGLHGLELIGELKRVSPSSDIIVITGFSESFPYVDVIDAGACDVIAKPCSTWEIEGKLLRVIRERVTRDQLILAQEKYRSLFELSIGSNLLLDAETLRVLDVNQSFVEFLERDRESILGSLFMDLVHPQERDRMNTIFDLLSKRGRGTVGDVRFDAKGQLERAADASLTYISMQREKFVLMNLVDITERRNIEKLLATAATTDQLTKLANRRAFESRLHGSIVRSRRMSEPMCLLMIDLDNFKRCNDTHGHQAGDEVLALLADVVRKSIRDGRGDEGFRLGGDEFAIVLGGAETSVAEMIAARMRTFYQDAKTYGTTLSIGIAQLAAEMDSDTLVKTADGALYQAKGQGKNSVCVA